MEHKTYNMEHGAWNIRKRGKPESPFSAPCSCGFALLFAMLASSVMLSIGLAILNIALREVTLSSYGRESVIAFYVADAGAECALYWGTGADAFSSGKISPINCGGGIQNVGGGGLS